jgi:hypothetical protein
VRVIGLLDKKMHTNMVMIVETGLVIARSESDEAIQFPAQASGLLRCRSQ